eukprot:scaffold305116_cov38-Prasinocladus_malaysianus.AAC.1
MDCCKIVEKWRELWSHTFITSAKCQAFGDTAKIRNREGKLTVMAALELVQKAPALTGTRPRGVRGSTHHANVFHAPLDRQVPVPLLHLRLRAGGN